MEAALILNRQCGNARYPCTPRALNEGFVERDKYSFGRSAAQVHGVGEFNAVRRKCQRGGHRSFILCVHILEAEQLRERTMNRALLKPVQTAEHPGGFEQHCFRDSDWLGGEARSCRALMLRVVASQQAD